MKKKYQKPTMMAVQLQQQSYILGISQGVKSVTRPGEFTLNGDGWDDNDEDM